MLYSFHLVHSMPRKTAKPAAITMHALILPVMLTVISTSIVIGFASYALMNQVHQDEVGRLTAEIQRLSAPVAAAAATK